jgi:drug/metabolite transporter (DMT)-like permease
MHKRRSFPLVDAVLLGAVLIWGSNMIVVKSALVQIPPLAFNAVRFVIAPALLLILTRLIEGNITIARKDWGLTVLVGLVGHFAHQVLFVQAMARTTATNAALILVATPAFVALMGMASKSERLSSRNWLGVLLSFAGIFLVIRGQGAGLQFGQQTLSGDVMMLGATVLWATAGQTHLSTTGCGLEHGERIPSAVARRRARTALPRLAECLLREQAGAAVFGDILHRHQLHRLERGDPPRRQRTCCGVLLLDAAGHRHRGMDRPGGSPEPAAGCGWHDGAAWGGTRTAVCRVDLAPRRCDP